ncbi:hypothetical protein [Amantichitinum ursilacus]|uniref:Uncharacterized protein n=1 Tax=Amantichitinum ursilacus TaxID=857265 RepID=A0A0N0GLN0_9NEIS|nr:hypothetical protein [Amantichitinum ursilacus]KPC50155.1 hypothetical protein WG78_18160 [Amantichitinum ursilacus]
MPNVRLIKFDVDSDMDQDLHFCKENLDAPTLSRACRYSLRLTAYFCEHVKAGDQIFLRHPDGDTTEVLLRRK